MSTQFWGVTCKSCRKGIALEEYAPTGGNAVEWLNPSRREELTCPNPEYGQTQVYEGDDFKVHDH